MQMSCQGKKYTVHVYGNSIGTPFEQKCKYVGTVLPKTEIVQSLCASNIIYNHTAYVIIGPILAYIIKVDFE